MKKEARAGGRGRRKKGLWGEVGRAGGGCSARGERRNILIFTPGLAIIPSLPPALLARAGEYGEYWRT